MKKVILFNLVLFLSATIIFSCSKEEDGLPEVDFSELRISHLKSLVNDSEAIKRHIKDAVMAETIRQGDTVPDDGTPDCSGEKMQEASNETYDNYGAELIAGFNSDARLFRDNQMLTGQAGDTGYTYKEVYYYLSGVLRNQTVSLSELTQFVNIVPTLTNVYERVNDVNYEGVVISSTERDEIMDFIEYYRLKVDSDLDKEIIAAIKDDLNHMTNRNRSQVRQFFQE